MSGSLAAAAPPSQRINLSQASCLCLGIALVMWGLAPVILDRVVTRDAPRGQALVVSSFTVLIGFVFIGLQLLIRRRIRWAMWTAFAGSLMLCTLATVLAMAPLAVRPGLFAIVLPGATTVTSWMALNEVRSKPDV